MKPRQKYVPLAESKILVLPRHKDYADKFVAQHGISINQLVRDVFEHSINCPFFNGRSSAIEIVPPSEGEGAK